jgi:hypothetical protein
MSEIETIRRQLLKKDTLCKYFVNNNENIWFATSINKIKCAVAICNGCIGKELCKQYAELSITNVRLRYGVWGGKYYSPRKKQEYSVNKRCNQPINLQSNKYLKKLFKMKNIKDTNGSSKQESL